MPSYDMIFARACASHAHRAWQISFSPSVRAPDVSFQRGFFTYVKLRADLQSKKFHFSGLQFIQLTLVKKIILIKNKKIGHLECISPFLVLPSIRRYRVEYLALYAVLATKYLFNTHSWVSNGLPK